MYNTDYDMNRQRCLCSNEWTSDKSIKLKFIHQMQLEVSASITETSMNKCYLLQKVLLQFVLVGDFEYKMKVEREKKRLHRLKEKG